jgi:hypothetical protein
MFCLFAPATAGWCCTSCESFWCCMACVQHRSLQDAYLTPVLRSSNTLQCSVLCSRCCLHQVEGRIINCGIINCSTEERDFVKAGCSCT